jgi:hypothetical protein
MDVGDRWYRKTANDERVAVAVRCTGAILVRTHSVPTRNSLMLNCRVLGTSRSHMASRRRTPPDSSSRRIRSCQSAPADCADQWRPRFARSLSGPGWRQLATWTTALLPPFHSHLLVSRTPTIGPGHCALASSRVGRITVRTNSIERGVRAVPLFGPRTPIPRRG